MTEQLPAVALEGPAKFVFDQFVEQCQKPMLWWGDANQRAAYISGLHAMSIRWLLVYLASGEIPPQYCRNAILALLDEAKRRTLDVYEAADAVPVDSFTPETDQ